MRGRSFRQWHGESSVDSALIAEEFRRAKR